MKTQRISGLDSHTRGRNQYEKLPRNEQLVKQAVEGARQNFNHKHLFYRIQSPKSDLGIFVQKMVQGKTIFNNVFKRFGRK